MYRAKESRGVYLFFDKFRDSVFIQQLVLEKDLKSALVNQEIDLAYQSLYNKDTLIGIEALVRWIHPTKGILMLEDFIFMAEKSNIILKIGEYVLRTACKHLHELHQLGYSDLFVLVNCTTKQFTIPFS